MSEIERLDKVIMVNAGLLKTPKPQRNP